MKRLALSGIVLVLCLTSRYIASPGVELVGPEAQLIFTGTASATGVLTKDSQNHARVGNSRVRTGTGKVKVLKVIVTDLFGREREVQWKYVFGKGTSRPTIKFTGEDKPKKDEHVSVELETENDGDHGILDLHLY